MRKYKPYPNNPAKAKYYAHSSSAKRRGISFNLTFEEWNNIWQSSGHWEERGCGKGQYVMSRYGDSGPYEVGNVFIQLASDNCSQALKGIPKTEEHKQAMRRPKEKHSLECFPYHIILLKQY